MAVHVVINGVKGEKLKTELLQIPDINLEKLTATCAKFEPAEKTLEELGKREEGQIVKCHEPRG